MSEVDVSVEEWSKRWAVAHFAHRTRRPQAKEGGQPLEAGEEMGTFSSRTSRKDVSILDH